jgi:folate-binding protein YgfZ
MVSGNEAAKFLQGQCTCDINQVLPHRGALSAYCNPQGRIIASFYVAKESESYLLVLPKTMVEIVVNKLAKFAIFSKVKVEDKTDIFTCFGFYLEKSVEEKMLGSIQDAHLFQCSPQHYLMLLEDDQLSKTDDLLAQLSVSMEEERVWKDVQIRRGITFIYPETSELVTPHMINYPLLGAVALNKGCYVGQEIIARTHYLGKSKRKLYIGIIQADSAPKEGDKLFYQEREVGIIMEISPVQEQEHRVLAVIQDQIDMKELT